MSRTSKHKQPPALSKLYLVLYNLVSSALWSHILISAATLALSPTTNFESLATRLRYTQTLAILDIVHILLGLVNSPLATSAIQLSSRLLVVWVNLHWLAPTAVFYHWSLKSLLVAWCVTESMRYLYYACALLNLKPYFLIWLRYSLFIVLYPMGVLSECALIYLSLPLAYIVNVALYYAFIFTILVVYPIGLYVLYSYMLRQRAKMLG